ncbi:MAG: hypothetical protein FJX61_02930 [Alphaproteobacteria bacterium]|nr:hypothetical protein [Alphaproteobacteria bacterium]
MLPRPRVLSLVLAAAAATVAAVALAPGGDPSAYLDRGLEAALVIGTIGAAVHALGWNSGNRVIAFVADPRFAWPATLVGAAYVALR